jgi:DinB superfamily
MASAGEALTVLGGEFAVDPAPNPNVVKSIIRRQMNQSGNILLTAIEPLGDDEFFAEGLNGVSAAWTLGHLACVMDLFTQWIEERELLIPDWMHNIFNSLEIEHSTKTKAASVDRGVLPKADILLLFRNTQVRTLKLLADFDAGLWESRTPAHAPESLPTYGSIWQNLGVHTFWHLGELCGSLPRFHGTHSLNTLAHYFYFRPSKPTPRSGFFPAGKG